LPICCWKPDFPETARKDLRVILQEAQRTKRPSSEFAEFRPPDASSAQCRALNMVSAAQSNCGPTTLTATAVDIVEHLDEGLPDVIATPPVAAVFLNILNRFDDGRTPMSSRRHRIY